MGTLGDCSAALQAALPGPAPSLHTHPLPDPVFSILQRVDLIMANLVTAEVSL